MIIQNEIQQLGDALLAVQLEICEYKIAMDVVDSLIMKYEYVPDEVIEISLGRWQCSHYLPKFYQEYINTLGYCLKITWDLWLKNKNINEFGYSIQQLSYHFIFPDLMKEYYYIDDVLHPHSGASIDNAIAESEIDKYINQLQANISTLYS